MDPEEVLEAAEDTLGEAVEIMKMTLVVEVVALIMQEQINRVNVVTKQPAMAR